MDIGEGIVSKEIIKKPFQSRDGNLVFDKKLERKNRKIFSSDYCPENGCEWNEMKSQSFESVALYKNMYLQAIMKGVMK